MATYRKRGACWQVQVRKLGHRPVSRTFKRRADAEVWARATEAQMDSGRRAPSRLRQSPYSMPNHTHGSRKASPWHDVSLFRSRRGDQNLVDAPAIDVDDLNLEGAQFQRVGNLWKPT